MKKRDKRKKRSVTLIEMIVVMLLIATITGALAYNYNASLNDGKAFKTKEGRSRIETILTLYMAENPTKPPSDVQSDWEKLIKDSPLVGKGADLTHDGWGKKYGVAVDSSTGEVKVTSQGLEEYEAKRRHE